MTSIKTIEVDNRLSRLPFEVTIGDTVWCAVSPQDTFALSVCAITKDPGGNLLICGMSGNEFKTVSWKDVCKDFPRNIRQ